MLLAFQRLRYFDAEYSCFSFKYAFTYEYLDSALLFSFGIIPLVYEMSKD